MKTRKIGLLFGMERTFPEALARRVNELGEGRVSAEPVQLDVTRVDLPLAYDLILDRISQDVPFYRTVLKYAALRGVQVINNPYWWTAEDKFTTNAIAAAAGVAIPKTFLLPHKSHPPGTRPESFMNLVYPASWENVFEELGFPIFLKPAMGGGWKHVSKVGDPAEFFAAYDRSGDLTMIAQEAIRFDAYYRCYVLGRERVRIMRYDPSRPYLQNYVADEPAASAELRRRMEHDAVALCRVLGHDFNTVEFAVRSGVPIAIDFTNPAPDADLNSVGPENFAWVVENAAEMLVERSLHPRPFELTGTWPSLFPLPAPPAPQGRPASGAASLPSDRRGGAPAKEGATERATATAVAAPSSPAKKKSRR
jgi:glutathione synthase/RimK-type ligase-like ATP-grasp enzyme